MNTLKKILIGCIIIVVLAALAASIYVKMYGKGLLEQALGRSLQREVRFESIAYRFPFGVRAGNVRVEPDFSAGEVLAQFVPESLWRGPRRVRQLIVNGGTYSYTGRGENPLRFSVGDIRLEAADLLIPLAPGHVNFRFDGHLVQPAESLQEDKNPLHGSRVEGSGWVDWVKRDLEGIVRVVDPGGNAALIARAVSRNNDMTVTGDLKLTGLPAPYKASPLTGQAGEAGLPAAQSGDAAAVKDLIAEVFSAAGVEVGARFSFKTKMDDLQISNISFSGKVIAGEGFEKIFSGESPASEGNVK